MRHLLNITILAITLSLKAAVSPPYLVPIGTNVNGAWWLTKPSTNQIFNWEVVATANTNAVYFTNLVKDTSNALQSAISAIPGGQSQWPLSAITNAGTAAYSNAAAFLLAGGKALTAGTADTALAGWPTQWPLSAITNAGTAAASDASDFLAADGKAATAGTADYADNIALVPSDTSGLIPIVNASTGYQPLTVNTTNLTWDGFSVTAGGFVTKGGSSYGEGAAFKARAIAPTPVAGVAQVYSLTNNGVTEAYVQNDGGAGGVITTKDFVSTSTNAQWGLTTNYVKAATNSVYSASTNYTKTATNDLYAAVMNNLPVNAIYTAGIVSAPGAVASKVWKTDGSGNPAWRDEAGGTPVSTITNVTLYNNILFAKTDSANYWWQTNDTAKQQLRFLGEAQSEPLALDWSDGAGYGAHTPNLYATAAYVGVTNAGYVGTDGNGKIVLKSAPSHPSMWEFNVSKTINGDTPTPLWTNAWASGPDYRKMVNYRLIGKAATSGSLYVRDEPVVHHASYGVLHDTYADVEQDLGSGGMQVTVTSNNVGLVWTVTGLAGENVAWHLVGASDGFWDSQ